jgi:rare lipoprotein A (peptidoglycan hydrolase)
MHVWAFVIAGVASWFHPLPMYGDMAVCATNAAPVKTDLLVINDENGSEAWCHVIGTGPFYGNRILDVAPSVAKKLGFLNAGTTKVRVYRDVGPAPAPRRLPQPVTIPF